jgi:hypothetical protein
LALAQHGQQEMAVLEVQLANPSKPDDAHLGIIYRRFNLAWILAGRTDGP